MSTDITVHPDAVDDRFDPDSEDLYEVLGVSRHATLKELTRAYRKASMKYHPDRNGGTEEAKKLFQRIKEAYETLSSHITREFYNNTGRRKPSDSEVEGKARELAHQVFTQCLDTAGANDHPHFDVSYYDPVAEVVDALSKSCENIRKMRNDLQRAISRLQNMRKRFKKKGADFASTPLANIIDSKISHNKKVWSMLEIDIKVNELALSFAREYSCTPDERPPTIRTVTLQMGNGNGWPPGWSMDR